MLSLPWVSSADKVKSGINKGRQRYKCKACQYFFTVSHKSDSATPDQRRWSLTRYVDPMGLLSFGQILGFRPVAVYHRVKTFGETLEQIERPADRVVERDELHSYLVTKKLLLGRNAIDRLGIAFSQSLAPEGS